MDKYNQRWVNIPRMFLRMPPQPFAITIGQTSYFTCAETKVDIAWHQHENMHKRQWKREGICFIVKYLWLSVVYGYWNNPYEVEARNIS